MATPVVTIDTPLPGAAVPLPFTVQGHVTDGVAGPPLAGATIELRNDVTGEFLGTTLSLADGSWSIIVTGAIAALRSATTSPRSIAASKRAGTTQPKASGSARRSANARLGAGDVGRRAETVTGQAKVGVPRAGKAVPNKVLTARRSGNAAASGSGTLRRAGNATPNSTSSATPLTLANGDFESAAVTATTEQTGAWWKTGSGPTFSITQYASTEISGAKVCRLFTQGTYDVELDLSTPANASLFRKFVASDFTPNTLLSFKVRPKQGLGDFRLFVRAYDSGGADLVSLAVYKNALFLWGWNGVGGGEGADTTTLWINTPAVNTTYAKSFDLKSWITGRLNSGKTWSDVAKVTIEFRLYTPDDTPVECYLDDFPIP